MKYLTIFGLIFIFLAANCAAVDPVYTGETEGKAILEEISANASIPSNNSTQFTDSSQLMNSTRSLNPTSPKESTAANSTMNQTTISQTSNTTKKAASDLWSWGSVPAGYTLDKSGNLVKLSADDEWLPNI